MNRKKIRTMARTVTGPVMSLYDSAISSCGFRLCLMRGKLRAEEKVYLPGDKGKARIY